MSAETRAEVLRLAQQGLSQVQIARQVGCSQPAVSKAIRAAGLGKYDHLSPAERATICERIADGETPTVIAADIGRPIRTITRIAEDVLRDPSRSRYRATVEVRRRIVEMHMAGASVEAICRDVRRAAPVVQREINAADPEYVGRRIVDPRHGYIYRHISPLSPYAPMAMSRGTTRLPRVYEHRLVMAKHLGRVLARGETVHHINGDPSDNRVENLQLRQGAHGRGVVLACQDCGSHNIKPVPLP